MLLPSPKPTFLSFSINVKWGNFLENSVKRFIVPSVDALSTQVILIESLNLINEFKNSSFKVIRIDFEEGTIEKDYNEKMIYNFGKLRRITKKI